VALPPLDTMWPLYPIGAPADVGVLVGGTIGDNITTNHWETCCIRLSRSLNYAGSPVHGFAGVRDYWTRASAKPWLAGVRVPLLALNARNDPFVPAASLPGAADVSAYVRLEVPEAGGHVGFFGAGPGAGRWYLRESVFGFLDECA